MCVFSKTCLVTEAFLLNVLKGRVPLHTAEEENELLQVERQWPRILGVVPQAVSS